MYKQVIILRKDLKLGFGKAVSQACHGSLGALRKADKSITRRWEGAGGKKVVLKVDNLEQLKLLYNQAKKVRLPCFLVRDAGLTQLKRGTVTCLVLGPADEKKIDELTKNLKLL